MAHSSMAATPLPSPKPVSSPDDPIMGWFRSLGIGAGLALAAWLVIWLGMGLIRNSRESKVSAAWTAYAAFEPSASFFTARSEPRTDFATLPDSVRPWGQLLVADKSLREPPLSEPKLEMAQSAYAALAREGT